MDYYGALRSKNRDVKVKLKKCKWVTNKASQKKDLPCFFVGKNENVCFILSNV